MPSLIITLGKRALDKNAAKWTEGFSASLTARLTNFLRSSYQNSYTGRLLNHNMTGESCAYTLLRTISGSLEKHLKLPERYKARQRELTYGALLILAALTALSFFFMPYQQSLIMLMAVLLAIGTFYRTEHGVYAAALLLPIAPLKALLALALVTLTSLIFKAAKRPHFRFHLSSLFIPLLLFYMVMFYATVTSVSFWDSAGEFFIPVTGLIYLFVIVNTFDSREKLDKLIICLAFAGMITASYAIYQFYTGVNTVEIRKEWVDITQNPEIQNRAYAVFENPNLLAQYLILLSTVSLGAAFSASKAGLRIFFIATVVIAAFCLLLTYSRGGWLAFAGALVVFALFKSKLLVQLLAVAGVFMYSFLPATITHRLSTITSTKDTSNLYRLDTWHSTLSLVKNHWETGVGLGRKAFARVYYTYMINSNVVPHSHNLYLQIISEFGILGLAVFCWLFVGIFRLGLKLSTARDALIRNLNAGIMGALAGFLFHSVVDYFLWYYKLGILLWLLIAIILVLEKLAAQKISSERNEQNA
ncbi:MAG: O-Antigen ligase [Pelotomaculum sp. PtaB.Bin013]|uniref:O-antigen ligase family protein n=1 Tax=Pelotomaculum isophthalicicum JI TaxID=947010 RepID=A0A9X4JT64_9FIRM|nr:O-antigen ligase family protein [Pelotomaculum isophthalicicum]MDF9406955.1 O-antigen ligase family protein [Pelotomaculum isophthalicicum JI]OPX90144.1 MAG: O-Antigen ligase [Pelotomaculum sp. PtaB.Bin013]